MNDKPFVSVIIPCRNEKTFIGRCLDSLMTSEYPRENLEVLVIDGMSKDGTRAIVEEYARRYPLVRLLNNPRKITPCALNIGIKNSAGEIIIRMDAHATYDKEYIPKCVKYLSEYRADNVGGNMITLVSDDKLYSEAVVKVLSSRFGVGNSAFRTGLNEPRYVDTVFGGCYKKQVFDKIGLFNENLARSQDIEFNLRLKQAGLKTLLVPEIISYYYPKTGFFAFLKHNFVNGMWAVIPFKYSKIIPVSPRSLVPLVFASAIILSSLSAFLSKYLVFAPLLVLMPYAAANIFFSGKIGLGEKRFIILFPMLSAAFASLHLGYGFGSVAGLIKVVLPGRIAPPEKEWPVMFLKRLFDIIFSLIGLALLSPILLAISFIIKKEDGGHVLYPGVRVGKNGRRFKMYKFRTMVVNADKIGGPSTADDDPRLLKIGKKLRKYKLDELPQLINVLKGDMSFVGPRPEVQHYTDMFTDGEKRILSVKPGITDWASLWNSDEGAILAGSSDPEKTYMEKIWPEKKRLQLKYVDERNFMGDMKIIFLTLAKIVRR